jgi:hypothetical protein
MLASLDLRARYHLIALAVDNDWAQGLFWFWPGSPAARLTQVVIERNSVKN